MEIDLELLRTLAALEGETVEIRDGCIVMGSNCPTYGGTYYTDTEQGVQDAIDFYTFCQLNPLDSTK